MVAQVNRVIILFLKKMLTGLILSAFFVLNAYAQNALILKDDETQNFLAHIVKPVFSAAHLPFDPAKIYILNDLSLNAFVSDGNLLFVHTGTLLEAENVNELYGILAHETGHISGGHILRQKLQLQNAQTLSLISLLAAGATAVVSGNAEAALAVASGTNASLVNHLLSYQVGEERSADESAVKYLSQINQSPVGLQNFMKKIQKKNRVSGYLEIPYFRSHPLTTERLSFFEKASQKASKNTASPYDTDLKFVQAKLRAFLLPTNQVQKIYPLSRTDFAAQYAHSILFYRQSQFQKALSKIESLLQKYPQNAYFWQFKGQISAASGQLKQAVQSFKTALSLSPDSPEIIESYAQTALELPLPHAELAEVISALTRLEHRSFNLEGWRLLSKAYHLNKQQAETLYAVAQYNKGLSNYKIAEQNAKKALNLHPAESLKLKITDLLAELETLQKSF